MFCCVLASLCCCPCFPDTSLTSDLASLATSLQQPRVVQLASLPECDILTPIQITTTPIASERVAADWQFYLDLKLDHFGCKDSDIFFGSEDGSCSIDYPPTLFSLATCSRGSTSAGSLETTARRTPSFSSRKHVIIRSCAIPAITHVGCLPGTSCLFSNSRLDSHNVRSLRMDTTRKRARRVGASLVIKLHPKQPTLRSLTLARNR